MDPITMSILASAASNIPGMILGASQLAKSNRMNPVRPTYEIPESERRALGVAEGLASQTRLPGQSAIEGRLDQTTANTLATIERMGYGGASDINAASRAYGNQLAKETELGVSAAGFQVQNQRNLEQALNRMAQYEDKEFQLNEMQPFLDESRAKAALYEGGMQNLVGGFKDTAGGVSNILLADAMKTGGYTPPVTIQTQTTQQAPETTVKPVTDGMTGEVNLQPTGQWDWVTQSFMTPTSRYKSIMELTK